MRLEFVTLTASLVLASAIILIWEKSGSLSWRRRWQWIALTLVGLWWGWPVLWLLPMATWYPLITRMRNIAEHALVAEGEPDPLRHARTTRANWAERALIAPYYVNYHCEHHMFMHLPCWRLPKAHRLLSAKGETARMEVQPGYLTVLRLATSAGTDHTKGRGRKLGTEPVATFG